MEDTWGCYLSHGFILVILLIGLIALVPSVVNAAELRFQIGAFSVEENLQRRLDLLEALGLKVEPVGRDRFTTAVQTGDLTDTEISTVRAKLEEQRLDYFIVIRENRSRDNQTVLNPLGWEELFRRIQRVEGVDYRWGGGSPERGFDCSGLLKWLLSHPAVPRTVVEMKSWTEPVNKNRLRRGDFIFFNFQGGRWPDHVGLYLGAGEFVHASSTYGVNRVSLERDYYQQRLTGFGRPPIRLVGAEE